MTKFSGFVRAFSASLAFGAAAFAVQPAAAQDAQDGEGNVIVVEGQLPDGGTAARQQARDITMRLGSTSEPLARMRRAVCPGVWGLQPQNAQAVIDRIYDNAERVGLEIDTDEGCAANVWVIFVDDAAQTFDRLRSDNGWMVDGLGRSERNHVEDQEGPARAWNIATTRTAQGQLLSTGFDAVASNLLSAQTGGLAGGAPAAQSYNMSRSVSGVRRDIEMSVVLISRSALANLDAYAVADYATMRAFARTDEPSRDITYDTVLTLFSNDQGPDRLTVFDISYLRAIYRGNGLRSGNYPLAHVDNMMVAEITGED